MHLYRGEEYVMCVMLCVKIGERVVCEIWMMRKQKKVGKKQPKECVEKGKRKEIILQNKHLRYVDFLKVTRMKILFKFLTQDPCN